MGEERFIHRLKLDLLLDAAESTKSPLLYFDGDVWFKKELFQAVESLKPGRSLMHAKEELFWNSRQSAIVKLRTVERGGAGMGRFPSPATR